MTEYIAAVTALITGIFAIGAAVVAWKLKTKETIQSRELEIASAMRLELKTLYEDVYVSFDHSIRAVRVLEEGKSAEELSRMSARIRLLAPEDIVATFERAHSLLNAWSVLYFNAHPGRKREGDRVVELIQAPDPGAKYKERERKAYSDLQNCLERLVEQMRVDLAKTERHKHKTTA